MKTKLKKLSKRTVSIILSVVMLVSMAVVGMVVANAWSLDGGKIYFMTPSGWDNSAGVQILFDYQNDTNNSHGHTIARIDSSSLFYGNPQYTSSYQYAFFNTSGWGNESNSIAHRAQFANNSNVQNWANKAFDNSSKYYLCIPSTDVTDNFNITYYEYDNLDSLKIAQNAYAYYKTPTATSYSPGSTGGTVKVTGYYFTSDTTITSGSSSSSQTASYNCAIGTTVTLTATPALGYDFDGWFTTANGSGNAVSSNTTFSYTNRSTAAQTYYARFSKNEPTYTVNATAGAGGTVSPSSGTAGATTTASFTATPDVGYSFSGWITSDSGITINSPSSATTTVNANDPGTITANFTENPTTTINVYVDENVQVTVSGSSVPEQNKTFTEDGDFTAHVGDVIEFSAAGQTSEYTYDVLKYSDGTTENTNTSFTVGSGTYTITATSKEKSGYYFYVSAGTGAKATVTIQGQNAVTVNAGTRQKFTVDDENKKFTITSAVTNTSTYESPTITKIVNAIDEAGTTVTSGSTQTKNDANGATYFVTATQKGEESSSYVNLSPHDSGQWNVLGHPIKKNVSGQMHYYITIPKAKFNGTDNLFVGISDNSYTDKRTSDVDFWNNSNGDSVTVSVASGSETYLSADKQNNGSKNFARVKFNESSYASQYDVLLDITQTNNGKNLNYEFSVAGSGGDITAFDTYYLGGRFRIMDGATNQYVYTDADEGSWQTYSIKMPFTKVGDTEYTLNTNQTIAQLSAQLDGKQPYFIVHNKKDVYHTSGNSAGLNFENNKDSSNALTLTTSGTLTYENELMFSDAESNSDGIVTIHYNPSTKTIWYTVENETAPVASSVQLEVKYNGTAVASTTAGNEVTLTATVTSPHANAGTMTYTFYNETTGQQIGDPVETTATTVNATVPFTENTVRTDTFKVVVSSTDTDSSTSKTLRDIWDRQDVQFTNAALYRTDVNLAGSTQTLVNHNSWNTTAIPDSTDHKFTVSELGEYQKYEFAIATAVPDGNADYTTLENNRTSDFYIDEKLTKYCDISYTTLTVSYNNGDDTEMYTVRTYTVVPRTNCANPTIHINTNAVAVKDANGDTVYYPGSIYATANYAPGKTNTKGSNEMVTYYFAEAVGDENVSKNGDGLSIAYWNNSLDNIRTGNDTDKTNAVKALNTYTAVATPVKMANGKLDDSGSNTIYVDMNKLYDAKVTDAEKQFKIYSVDLPIWATSFAFTADEEEKSDVLWTKSWNDGQYYVYSSLLLNPNRVYLLYKKGNDTYSKGVVLDKGLWDSNTKNTVDTKTFKSNVINYNGTYNNDEISNALNSNLSSRVYADYENNQALYIGLFNYDVHHDISPNLNDFLLVNNLAMRGQRASDYHASIQNLVAEKLDTDNVNSNGFPLLEAYTDTAKHNKKNMPLFDYDALAADKSSYSDALIKRQFQGVDFPMYESTFNGITTYSYDSSTDPNRAIDSTTQNFVIDSTWRKAAEYLGYAPFAKTDNGAVFGNATELDLEFFMSNTGNLKDKNGNPHDITFNFSGDDDVWVYIDGILVLDLGGAHMASAGTINFTDMKVYYKTAANDTVAAADEGNGNEAINAAWAHQTEYVNTIDLQALLKANGNNFNNKDGNTKHTFQMFYMERGAHDSNMSVSFNLPQASGLNINNQISANNVNMGLKEAALYAANSDYFTYGVSAALNSGNLYNNTTAAYAGANNNTAAETAINAEQGPVYPMNTNTDRVFSTTVARDGQYQDLSATYPLSRSNSGSAEGARYNQTTSFTGLNDVTYSLSDKYLTEANGHTSGNLEVSGKTSNTGEFNLLGGQTATFEDKVTPHSFVKVYQKSDLGKANTAVTPIGYSSVSANYTNNYYVTSYSIYDDHSSTWIKPKTSPIVSTGSTNNFYAADNSANSNMFYFSDYGKISNSAAMTVTFYNDIAVGDIRISKDYNGDENTTFYYDLKFANIFGSDDDALTTLVAYNHIAYDVVETATGALVAKDRAYGKTGIALKKGQTAIISGVPVETIYKVTERPKSGTMLNAINKYVEGPDGAALENPIPSHGYAENFNSQQITDLSIRGTSDVYQEKDSDKYYINMIPIIQESYKNGAYKTTSYVEFENLKTSIKINFHYYDRKLTNGVPATISQNPTAYTVNTSLSDDLMDVTNDNAAIRTALKNMIEGAAVEFIDQALTQNVVDDYVMWSSLADASDDTKGIGAQTNIKTLKPYKNETDNYSTAKEYHTNSLSQLLTTDHSDVNKWVSYKTDNNFVDAESFEKGADALEIKEVNVWLFNTPHEYKVNIYGAKSISDLSAPKTANVGGKTMNIRVASSANSRSTLTDKAYYNQRLGEQLNDTPADSTAYISQYNRPSYRPDIEPVSLLTEDTLTNNGKSYRFAYWSYDPAGQIVASRDAYYYYRVTRDLDLYAVYAETQLQEKVDVGLSIFSNRNDVYVDTSGVSRTRMNVVINPYALEDTDSSLQQTALVYVNLSDIVSSWDDTAIMDLFNQYRDQLDTILTAHPANSFSSVDTLQAVSPIKINNDNVTEVTLTTKGFVRNAFRTGDGFIQTIPTRKNRLQYTLSIKTATLKANTKLMFVGAMYYNGNYETGANHWKISDNFLIYENGTCKDLEFGRN